MGGSKETQVVRGRDHHLRTNGDTLLTSLVEDQVALHSLLRKVRDLGTPLISTVHVKPLGEPVRRRTANRERRTTTTNEITGTDELGHKEVALREKGCR